MDGHPRESDSWFLLSELSAQRVLVRNKNRWVELVRLVLCFPTSKNPIISKPSSSPSSREVVGFPVVGFEFDHGGGYHTWSSTAVIDSIDFLALLDRAS